MYWKHIFIMFIILIINDLNYSNGGAIELTDDNFNKTLDSSEIVVVNFYAHWCVYSQNLLPIFDEVADKIQLLYNNTKKINIAKINVAKHHKVRIIYNIQQFPIISTFFNKQESYGYFIGPRTVTAILRYVINQIMNPVQVYENLDNLEPKRNESLQTSIIVGYFNRRNQNLFEFFEKLARYFKHNYEFRVYFNSNDEENGLIKCWSSKNNYDKTELSLKESTADYKNSIKWFKNFCLT